MEIVSNSQHLREGLELTNHLLNFYQAFDGSGHTSIMFSCTDDARRRASAMISAPAADDNRPAERRRTEIVQVRGKVE